MYKYLPALMLTILCTACGAPATREELPDAVPGYTPDKSTDEAGLWMHMDLMEEQIKTSGQLVRDPELNRYVRDVACRVTGPYCGDLRVYIMRVPHFNASMAPNGVLLVWTGLLLRATNEAQLAYVLSHEAGHYLRRHSLQMWRDTERKSSLFTVLNVIGATIGVPGYAYDIAQLSAIGGTLKFSRDSEREADRLGYELSTFAGYDPRQAPLLWEALVKESEADDDSEPWIFFSTHPHTKERIATLSKLAEQAARNSGDDALGEERYAKALAPWRGMFLRDELQQRRFGRAEVLLDRLIASGRGLGELYYYQGELYRLRRADGDQEKAQQAYRQALRYQDAPPETHRELGAVYMQSGAAQQARAAFQRYLQLRPEAEDREMIRAYMEQLR